MTNLSELDYKEAQFIEPTEHVFHAVHLMAKFSVGFLIVSKGNNACEGVISERDILRGIERKGPEFLSNRICDCVLHTALVIDASKTVEDACAVMEKNKIRHLPVVSKGRVLGVLGAREIFSAFRAGRKFNFFD